MILKIDNLHKIYPNQIHALKGVSLEVNEGEFVAVIGLSGSGKSTLLRCINKIIEPTSGKVFFLNQDLTLLKGKKLREIRKKIGMVFQQFNLVENQTVLKNVISGKLGFLNTLDSVLENFNQELINEAMEKLSIVGLADRAYERGDKLSGGQKQRVAVARSLMQHPVLLLADEPVASLDPATSGVIMQYLEKANKEFGMTVICNLHFLSLVKRYASRVIGLKEGVVVFQGAPMEISSDIYKEIYGEDSEEVDYK